MAVVQHSTHLHTNSTQNDTKQTIHRTTQKFGRVRAVPRLCGFYPGICLTTEEKARKTPSQGWLIHLNVRVTTHGPANPKISKQIINHLKYTKIFYRYVNYMRTGTRSAMVLLNISIYRYIKNWHVQRDSAS